MAFKLILLGCLIASCTAKVMDLGDSDFKSKVATHENTLVMFYAPWCGHCKRMKPEFDKAAIELAASDPPVQLIKVDCTEAGKDTCGQYGVSGYPTLKQFTFGADAKDYNGPREASGIIKYMKSQVGPVSKELKDLALTKQFLAKLETTVVFYGDDSSLQEAFTKAAKSLRESVSFGHSNAKEVLDAFKHQDKIVLTRPTQMKNKFEEQVVVYEGKADSEEIKKFIKNNYHGIAGHRTADNMADFASPSVIAFYNVDYEKNAKQTNYWRNRVLKVAKNYPEFKYGVANKNDFNHELEEFGITYFDGEKPVICATDKNGAKFPMTEDFSVENFEAFMKKLTAGELEPFLKSEAIPESQGNVLVAVGKNFDELVTNSGRDALLEFYAPWCGHCKKLTPIYEELGEKMANEDVDIIKMDATANDVPKTYNVRGFPTLIWKTKDGKTKPYQGGRELDDFVKFIAEESTEELKGFNRDGSEKQKTEL